MDKMNEKPLKEGGINEKELELIRESFIETYCKQRGWDPDQLTSEQLNEIKNQEQYKTPILLS